MQTKQINPTTSSSDSDAIRPFGGRWWASQQQKAATPIFTHEDLVASKAAADLATNSSYTDTTPTSWKRCINRSLKHIKGMRVWN
jgi:hypothetical protein